MVSNSYESRKILTNSLLVSKGNYQLPLMMGLKDGDFKRMQKGIDNFIHKKRIYRGRGKYCTRTIGGISSPKMFERYITSQLTWLKRFFLVKKVAIKPQCGSFQWLHC